MSACRMPVSIALPWRSVWLPRVAVFVALVVGLPLFLRMPLWCDITLYELAARNLLEGGTHYRDIFDTNLPGFVWLLTGLRWLFGPAPIVIRITDLVVIVGIVALIDRLAKWGGATPATRWWSIAGATFLYPFTVEMTHAQRDVWMTLPALAAVVLRVRRAIQPHKDPEKRRVIWPSTLEGVLWGLAVWIKPHIVLMAAGVWILTARRLAVCHTRPGRAAAADLLGNLMGGVVVGLAGIGWLLASGTWKHFWDVVERWNPEYAKLTWMELPRREVTLLHWFPVWSLGLIPTVPLAVLSLVDGVSWGKWGRTTPGPVGRALPRWLWDREAGPDSRFTRAVIAALYLVWVLQGYYLQRGFMYVHLPETLLMLGLWAAHRWAFAALPLLWIALTSLVWLVADSSPAFRERLLTVAVDKHASASMEHERYIVRHPLADWNWVQNWSECLLTPPPRSWRIDETSWEQYQLWDHLGRIDQFVASPDWEELAEVARYLQQQGVKDGEVIAWNDTPHAVYLMLGIKPGVRYIHTTTVEIIGVDGNWLGRGELEKARTAAGTHPRFAIGDLEWAAIGQGPSGRARFLGPPQSPTDLLPAGLSPGQRAAFPFDKPTVFRSGNNLGRYTVHRLR